MQLRHDRKERCPQNVYADNSQPQKDSQSQQPRPQQNLAC